MMTARIAGRTFFKRKLIDGITLPSTNRDDTSKFRIVDATDENARGIIGRDYLAAEYRVAVENGLGANGARAVRRVMFSEPALLICAVELAYSHPPPFPLVRKYRAPRPG